MNKNSIEIFWISILFLFERLKFMGKWFKIIAIIFIIVVILEICNFFIKTNYKTKENGNNKNIQEIEEYILNVSSYKAKIKVTICSNKNTNFYEFEQEAKGKSYSRQLALYPDSLAGMEIIFKNGIITVQNTKYSLSQIYENYPFVGTNSLYLTSFIEGYRTAESKEIKEIEGKIQMTYTSNINKYNNKQVLYIDKANLEPKNLQVYDINNELRVDIIYNEIELNI